MRRAQEQEDPTGDEVDRRERELTGLEKREKKLVHLFMIDELSKDALRDEAANLKRQKESLEDQLRILRRPKMSLEGVGKERLRLDMRPHRRVARLAQLRTVRSGPRSAPGERRRDARRGEDQRRVSLECAEVYHH